MRKNKKLSLLVATMMVAMAFTGCGEKEKETKETVAVETTTAEQAETTGAEGETLSGESEASDFDFSQVLDNIEIDGKKIPLPFTLNELGDEFDVDMIVEFGNGTCGADLLYKNEKIATVDCIGDTKEDIDRDATIYGINLTSRNYEGICINGINCKSSLEDVEACFEGLKQSISDEGRITLTEAVGENGELFSVAYKEDTSIRTIFIKCANK